MSELDEKRCIEKGGEWLTDYELCYTATPQQVCEVDNGKHWAGIVEGIDDTCYDSWEALQIARKAEEEKNCLLNGDEWLDDYYCKTENERLAEECYYGAKYWDYDNKICYDSEEEKADAKRVMDAAKRATDMKNCEDNGDVWTMD